MPEPKIEDVPNAHPTIEEEILSQHIVDELMKHWQNASRYPVETLPRFFKKVVLGVVMKENREG